MSRPPHSPSRSFDPDSIAAAILDHPSIAVLHLLPDGVIRSASPGMTHLSGHPVATLLGRKIWEVLFDQESVSIRADALSARLGREIPPDFTTFRTVAERSNGRETDWTIRHFSGRPLPVRLALTPTGDPDSEPTGYLAIFTESSQPGERRLTERLQLATLAGSLGVIDYDVAAAVAHWDDQMFALYGIDPTSDNRIDLQTWATRLHPEEAAETIQGLRDTLANGTIYDHTFRVCHPEKGVRHIRSLARVIRAADGSPLRFVGVNSDVTESVLASRRLHEARDLAEKASHAKSEFLAMMSHEIRTPLNGIIGFARLLAESPLSDEQRDYLQTIQIGSETLLSIIHDILDFSKIEAGRIELEHRPFVLATTVSAALELLSEAAAAKNLALSTDLDPTLPERILGDPARVQQVLTNLLGNAIKFTERGSVSLTVRPGTLPDGQPALHLIVSDTGIGIPPEKIPAIFQPFSQLDVSDTRRFGGTGLGLSICQRLVTVMQGEIALESTVGVGTTAHVRLRLEPAAPSESAAPAPIPRVAALPQLSPDAAALRILVAEDNPTNQRLIALILKRIGARHVNLVADGSLVLEYLDSDPADLILMDCQMPVMDGYEATRRIRQAEAAVDSRDRTRIIALTAAALDDDRARAFASGMDDYLTKPVRPETLVEALERSRRDAESEFGLAFGPQ